MRATPLSPTRMLAFGCLVGGALGLLAGLCEAELRPLELTGRILFLLGADGLLGTAWGLLSATVLLPISRARKSPRSAASALGALVSLPAWAAGLAFFANRVLLRGTHFLSPVSLILDALAFCAGAALALLTGKLLGRLFQSPRREVPGIGAAVALIVLLTGAFLLPPRFLSRGSPDPALPTIVLVSIDTLRPDRLGSGGEPSFTSPAIDRILREGLSFEEALAVSPGSAPSHAALLTSRYPISNGVWTNFTVMDTSVTTLAEMMREMGYRTGGFVTNTFLGKRFQFDQGFDAYVESGVVERLEEPSAAALRRSLAIVQIFDRIRTRTDPAHDPSFETALSWIRESDRPAFFFVHLMDVHSPYVPPRPYGPRFGAHPEGTGQGPRNRFGWRPSEEAYLAEIRFADSKIGRLRRTLEDEGILDECLLVLTSDHGENLLDHEPHFGHGVTLFEATLRILTSIRAPRYLTETGIRAEPIENVDILPSLASLIGWTPRAEWEGRNVLEIPRGAPPRERPSFLQLNRDFAARTSQWKLLVKNSGDRDYYVLDTDPGETQLQTADPDRLRGLEVQLQRWIDRYATGLYQGARVVQEEELPPEVIEKLKTLGYID